MKKLFMLSLIIFLSLILYSFNFNNYNGKTLKNKKAVDFTLTDINGKEISLSDFRGKIILLNFWATWSASSLKEMSYLKELAQNYKDKIQVIGIAVVSKKSEIPKKVKSAGVTYPVLYGTKKTIADYGFFNAIPNTFIIDRNGIIAKELPGSHKFEELEKALKSILYPKKRKTNNHLTSK